MAKSIMQSEKYCFITGVDNVPMHRHHIYFGNPNRMLSEKYGLWVWLIPEMHNMSNHGVHFDHELDLELKRAGQRRFEEVNPNNAENPRDDFRRIFGRNYLGR